MSLGEPSADPWDLRPDTVLKPNGRAMLLGLTVVVMDGILWTKSSFHHIYIRKFHREGAYGKVSIENIKAIGRLTAWKVLRWNVGDGNSNRIDGAESLLDYNAKLETAMLFAVKLLLQWNMTPWSRLPKQTMIPCIAPRTVSVGNKGL